MNYTVKLDDKGAQIVELPEIYLHFAHHDFRIVWSPKTKRHDSVKGLDTYYGGMGEGSSFDTWQDAIHTSLYDAYQVYEGLNDGDTLTAEYLDQTALFRCEGVHVVPA